LDLPADSTEYFLKDDSPQCDGCWGFDLDEAIAQGQVTGTLVEWQTDLFNLVAFAAFYEVNLLSRDVVLKWQKLEEHWGSVPPYAIIKTTGERQDDEEPDLDRDHPFSKYLIERYRFIAKVEWINCGCRCCSNRSSPAPHRRTLPESFKAQMVSLDQTAPTSFNWCDFHGHKGDDEKIMCQEHRWSNSECSESEDFYQEYFMRDNPEAGAYNYDQPGYWADGGRK
jgi:hypothetical protein